MTTDTIGSERATNTVQIIQAKPDSIMNLSEAQKLERKQAEESDYYNVLLWDEAARRQVRVRTCCWVLDAERKPVTNEDGKRTYRDAHEVALDVWAAYGADEHTLICLQLGPVILANADSRSEEHTYELQSLKRISYAVYCLKKKNKE